MEDEAILQQWALNWGIPPRALADLSQRLCACGAARPDVDRVEASEAWVQSRLLLDAGYRPDVLLFRNNVGVLEDANGRPVRYGLANDSARVNKSLKSGDTIGVLRYEVKPSDVGRFLGLFLSVETKKVGWRPSPTDSREAAQCSWANLINSYGGVARFYAGHGNFFDSLEQQP